ncbi:glycoside hydrolase family 15 protein [soil metagenome]
MAQILDHAVVGNGRVLALVSPRGSIDWACLPRFDSPSVFGRILDDEDGGSFRIEHRDGELAGELDYVPRTNVVRTVFSSGDSSWEVIDFAPRVPEGLGHRIPIELIRVVRPLSGVPRLRVVYDPRPDYGRVKPTLRQTTNGVVTEGGASPVYLATNMPVPYLMSRRDFALTRPIFFVVSHGQLDHLPSHENVERDLAATIAGWRQWARSCALPSYAPEAVMRSALCLKLHAYHDTGAIIAATTTSIPEALGTERTWDYRYCWLRDSAFVIEALRRLSQLGEGESFLAFLRNVAEAGPLQPVYAIDGERELHEIMLPHLKGFANNGFVRIGNAAYLQKQNDLMGELVLSMEALLGDPRVEVGGLDYMPLIERLVDEAIVSAPTKDTGIWEFRSFEREYTFSRAMCWAATERGAILARGLGRSDLATRWEETANRERAIILKRAYSEKLGFFTQALDGDAADASNLLLPTLGLLPATDPRFLSTLDAYAKELVVGGLVLRYKNLDDFGQTHSAFTICSFWWAEALAMAGRLDEAMAVFDHVSKFATKQGLFSEDIDPKTGQLLGNFPQAYTHVGQIHAAMTIGALRDARDGHVRAWT